MRRYITKDARQAAIASLVNNYLGRDGSEFGILIENPDFNILIGEIEGMRKLGNSPKWSAALTEWQQLVTIGYKTFCDQNGYSYLDHCNYTLLDFPDKRAYATAFKYALCFGAMNAQIGA